MIVIWIILIVLLFILILTLFSVSFVFAYDEKFLLKIKYLFLSYKVVSEEDNNEDDKGYSEKKKEEDNAVSPKEAKGFLVKVIDNFKDELKNETSLSEKISLAASGIKLILNRMKWVLRHTKVQRFNVSITVAGEDAAEVAIEYGKLNGVIYPIVGYLAAQAKLYDYEIDLNTDFNDKKNSYKADVIIKVPLIILLSAAIYLFFHGKGIYKAFFKK